MERHPKMLIVLMGVSGAGKTMIGKRLAAANGAAFYDADDYHSRSAVAKMTRGEALNDADRAPWLERLAQLIAEIAREDRAAVLACSALKARYRSRLRRAARDAGLECIFVYLKISREVAEARLRERPNHYMPASLVNSQFAALEEPTDAFVVDAAAAPQTLLQQIRDATRRLAAERRSR
jgi:gluconokinase